MSLTATLFETIAGRRKQEQADVYKDIRSLAIAVGRDELGVGGAQKVDVDSAADALAASGMGEADFRVTVDLYKRRIAWAKLAKHRVALQKKSEQAERARIDADRAETARLKAAFRNLEALKVSADSAMAESSRAMAAEADLIGGAEVTAAEKALEPELRKLNDEAVRLQNKLRPTVSLPAGGGTYMIDINPAAMARDAREELADAASKQFPKDRTDRLRNTVEVAEAAVAQCERELAEIEKKRAAVNKKSAVFNTAKAKPESFRIVRAKASFDEQSKALAAKLGHAIVAP